LALPGKKREVLRKPGTSTDPNRGSGKKGDCSGKEEFKKGGPKQEDDGGGLKNGESDYFKDRPNVEGWGTKPRNNKKKNKKKKKTDERVKKIGSRKVNALARLFN